MPGLPGPQGLIATGGTADVIAPGATGGPLYLTKNGAGAPPYSFAGDTNTGLDSSAADTLDFVIGGGSALVLSAAALRLGLAASATPAAQTLTLGENSRAGTDTNVGGSSGTIRSGLGTGTGTASSLIFQTPDVTGAGSGVQSYTTRLTLDSNGATATLLFGTSGVVYNAGSTNGISMGYYDATALQIGSGVMIRFASGSIGGGNDVGLYRKAAGILQLNTGTADAGAALEFNEQTAPSAPAADGCRLYCVDAAGKTQLRALFNSGASQLIAAEP